MNLDFGKLTGLGKLATGKAQDIISASKVAELLRMREEKEKKEKICRIAITVLTIIGIIAVVGVLAYGLSRLFDSERSDIDDFEDEDDFLNESEQ